VQVVLWRKLTVLLIVSVLLAWDGFLSGDFFWAITGVLGILFFVLGIVAAFSGFSGATAPAAKRTRSIPQDVKIAVAVRDQGLCQHCGTSAGPMQYDHVIPYSVGGDNSVENIQLLCRRCNAAKSNRYVG
jgi:hypothetical protein